MDKLKQIPARFLEIWKSWSRNQKIIIVSAVAVFIAAQCMSEAGCKKTL